MRYLLGQLRSHCFFQCCAGLSKGCLAIELSFNDLFHNTNCLFTSNFTGCYRSVVQDDFISNCAA
jgi:hypothetical protein